MIIEALAKRGIEANLIGLDPTNEAEYLERVTFPNDDRPVWNEINLEAQNLNQVHAVSKYIVILRLEEAGKFNAALAALKSDDLLYQKWLAVTQIKSNDQPARGLVLAL